MKKIYVAAFGLAVTAIALTYACKRSEGMEPQAPDRTMAAGSISGIRKLKGGHWLDFPTMEHFNRTMQELHSKYQNPQTLGQWESANTPDGYVSLRKFYELTDADTSERRTAPTVDSLIASNQLLDCPDSWFATVLSRDGFIQIADTVYSFRPGKAKGEAYAVPERHIAALLQGQSPENMKDAKVHFTSFFKLPIPKWPEVGSTGVGAGRLPICMYPSGAMFNWWGQVGDDIYGGDNGEAFPEHNGRQVKLQYHRWRVGYIFYASVGVRVKMLKHTRFAGWLSNTYAEEMMMEACCKGFLFIPGIPLIPFNAQTSPAWPSLVSYTENSMERTLKWTATGLMNDILLEHFNFHFRVNYRSRIVERNIRQ